jgi:hypothetical protein
MKLSYDDHLRILGAALIESAWPDGGWAMRRGERRYPPSVLGTAYALSILRYAGYGPGQPRVVEGIRFLINAASEDGQDEITGWSTRQAVHSILGLSEWTLAMIEDANPTDGQEIVVDVSHAIDYSLSWLHDRQTGAGGWPSTHARDAHVCVAWTSSVLYALARLRARGHQYRDHDTVRGMLTRGRKWLLDQHAVAEPRGGFWAKCQRGEPSAANTALAVIALSHRHLTDGSPRDVHATTAADAGRDWLLDTSNLWSRNEAGEDDPASDDGWQHVVWSLAPRACLSAGAPPQHPNLQPALRHAFDRWGDRPFPGWYISGVGKTAYANWSVVQLGQVLRLAISRQDPVHVLDALTHTGSEPYSDTKTVITLEPVARTASIEIPGQSPQTLVLAASEKQWKLLQAFADAQGSRTLTLDALDPLINPIPKHDKAWGALKALCHTLNEGARQAFADKTLLLLSCTTRGATRQVTLHASCQHQPTQLPPPIPPLDISEFEN